MTQRPHFLRPLLRHDAPARPVLRCGDRPLPLATTVETAFDSATRKRGLLGRQELPAGTALVIAPCSAVHTFGMQFPIDVVYAARDGRIVKLRRALGPGRISAAIGAFAAIELAAGTIERLSVQIGDTISVDT